MPHIQMIISRVGMSERVVVPTYTRVNLDTLFGNVFDNVVIERITPYKIAVYLLLRSLDEQHHTIHGFDQQQHAKLFALLFGMVEHVDMTFSEVKRIAQNMDDTVRKGIYHEYMMFVETFLDEKYQLSARIDDLCTNAMIALRGGKVTFIATKCYFTLWMKKMHYAWWIMPLDERRVKMDKFRDWTKATGHDCDITDVCESLAVPFEIESSVKARRWIAKQTHCMQVCPSSVLPFDAMMERCASIKQLHPDITNIHVLELLCHINQRNYTAAQASLRAYFDYSMFRLNDSFVHPAAHSSKINRLGTTDHRPLRYAPLLQARLSRIFGDTRTARHLLLEAIQQAQTKRDHVCLRLVVVELAAVEAYEATRTNKEKKASEVKWKNSLSTANVLKMLTETGDHEENQEIEFGKEQPNEAGDLNRMLGQLSACSHLFAAITSMRNGDLKQFVVDKIESALRVSSGTDASSQCRLIQDAATVTLSSVHIANGEWTCARTAAAQLTETNFSDGVALYHDTEAHAIAGVNIVYSYAAEGKWTEATKVLDKLKKRFTRAVNWQTSSHVEICDALVSFDRNFVIGSYDTCRKYLKNMNGLCGDEAVFRRSLLLAVEGNVSEGIRILEERIAERERQMDLITRLRAVMQKSMLEARCERTMDAIEQLRHVLVDARRKGLASVIPMAQRRIAVVQLKCGLLEESFANLEECMEGIERHCTSIEKALFHLTKAKLGPMNGRNDVVECYSRARHWALSAGFPMLEMLILREAAMFFHQEGRTSERNQLSESFLVIHKRLRRELPKTFEFELF